MQIITLTTDWGLSDYYVGVVKGRLYSMIHDVLVVDITHGICDYDIVKTAFIVKNACCEFPEGSIHIIDVNSYEQGETNYSKARPYLAIKHNNQFYICTDDGMPSVVFGNDPVEIVEIDLFNETDYYTFSALDLFPKVAKMIAENNSIDKVGRKINQFYNLVPQTHFILTDNNTVIKTQVIYVDNYGNLFLNIKDTEFYEIRKERGFVIRLGIGKITKISSSYADVAIGDLLLTISSSGYLQIALREGNCSGLLSIKRGDTITITFDE